MSYPRPAASRATRFSMRPIPHTKDETNGCFIRANDVHASKPKQTRTAKQVQFHITTYPSPLPHITTSPLLHLHSLTLTGNLENSPS